MAFIDGNNGENFATEGLIQRLQFFCVIKERVMQAHECYTDCNMFVNGHCLQGVEREFFITKNNNLKRE